MASGTGREQVGDANNWKGKPEMKLGCLTASKMVIMMLSIGIVVPGLDLPNSLKYGVQEEISSNE